MPEAAFGKVAKLWDLVLDCKGEHIGMGDDVHVRGHGRCIVRVVRVFGDVAAGVCEIVEERNHELDHLRIVILELDLSALSFLSSVSQLAVHKSSC
jgi:hypothetical protein